MRQVHAVALALSLCAACSDGSSARQDQAEKLADASFSLPRPEGALSDAANILDPGDEALLSSRLNSVFEMTGHQVVVVTVPTLNGRDVEDYTLELFNQWGVGSFEHPGVVLLVAPNERAMRIEIGRGLQQKLSDDACAQIIEEVIVPHFRTRDYGGGINAGVSALARHLV